MADLHFPFEAPAGGQLKAIHPDVRWLRMPMPMKLDHINLYLLRHGDGFVAVDTGLATKSTRQHWLRVLSEELQGAPLKALIVTHLHPDHIGLAGWLCQQTGAELWMSQAEFLSAHLYQHVADMARSEPVLNFYQQAGFCEAVLVQMQESAAGFGRMITPLPFSYRVLEDGADIEIGGRSWRVMIGAGHSVAHACLHCDELGMLLGGDQALPGITPNVALSSLTPQGDPLNHWFETQVRLAALPQQTLVLPSHELPFTGLPARCDQVIAHHRQQLELLLQACGRAQTAVQLLPVLFKRALQGTELVMAAGECLAHLNYLCHRGKLVRRIGADGVALYQRIEHG
ncbi:MBL fold metallo-hydrolase [Ferrimonas pelagia]|uniref:MBL fold metallo-hydrolase n=1 Tax=Ferrimonas pelagia TaxID=1177826 RepID=A0ABP9EPD7_9GAMM